MKHFEKQLEDSESSKVLDSEPMDPPEKFTCFHSHPFVCLVGDVFTDSTMVNHK